MTELSKFINLLIEYEQKVEGHLNKKYKPFVRKLINLETLAKSVSPQKVVLSRELMVFKLGLQAKSSKAVQISLNYLVKLFQFKFVDLNQPNYCEQYIVEENGVKEVSNEAPKTEIRHALLPLIRQNLHYKHQDINALLVKLLEFLITEPVLQLVLECAIEHPQDSTSTLLFNYFSFRFHVYEQICYYSDTEMNNFPALTLRSQKTQKEIKRAFGQHNLLTELVQRYMQEYLSIVDGSGGRYGRCVMCGEPAQHYCKITKASLCGIDCKKKHIELAEKEYRHQFQAVHLWETITTSLKMLMQFLQARESPLALSVLANLLEKPYLFMLAKKEFRRMLGEQVRPLFAKLITYRNEACFEHIYLLLASLSKHWLYECLPQVEYFFREYIIKVLQEKKPSQRFLNLVLKALARILQHGKVTVQLYINLDCETNKENVLQKVLFQLAKIAQDRFATHPHFSKHEKLALKNHTISLYLILAMGLNEYRRHEPRTVPVDQVIQLKQKKMSLEQFVIRFNEHWTSGLKTLFNLNLVGLDSNEEIVDILLTLKGLSKDNISEYLSCEKGALLFDIFLGKLMQKHQRLYFIALLDLHHYLPLKTNSVCLKKLVDRYRSQFELDIEKETLVCMDFLCRNFSQQQFKKFIASRQALQELPHEVQKLHQFALQARQSVTLGNQPTFFTYCSSRSYLQVIANQLTLLQIPLSYLLENRCEIDRVINLAEELVQICPHSNWLALLTKNSNISLYPSAEFGEQQIKIVMGTLAAIEKQAAFVQDWSTLIHFIAQLRYALLLDQKQQPEGKSLSEKLSISVLERVLLQAAARADRYFGKLLLAVLGVAREEIEKDSLFVVQKFFEIIDANLKKFLLIVEDFMPFLLSFTKQLEHASPETCISVADMLKQSFAKLLKIPKTSRVWAQGAEADFWRLFENLSNHPSRQVRDFVVNCITMAILHHYELSYKSWITLFTFMKRRAKDYRQQVYTILEKIINEKLRNCEEFYPDIVDLALELIHPEQTKISTEALLALRHTVELTAEAKTRAAQGEGGEEERAEKEVKSLVLRVQENIINYIFYHCHEQILDTFFKLLACKNSREEPLLAAAEVDLLTAALFAKIEEYSPETLFIAEKTINYTLTWSHTHNYPQVISLFTNLVIGKYHALSLSAIRCIKTYLQMTNPRSSQQWQPLLTALNVIATDTRLSHTLDLALPDPASRYTQEPQPDDSLVKVDVNLLANQMVAQKMVVQMMPNLAECLPQLTVLHQQVVAFNDNLYLRCLLWRKGLGDSNPLQPPNLLTLQDSISGKLVATYNVAKQNQIIPFALQIYKRYCHASELLVSVNEYIRETHIKHSEIAQLLREYLQARKVPLLRVMSYFLPKFVRFCKTKEQRKDVVLWVVESCKYVQNRQPFLKAVKELTKKE